MHPTMRTLRIPAVIVVALASLAVIFSIWRATWCRPPMLPLEPALKARPHRTLAGHSATVWQVAFSPDGQTLASGSVDRTVRLWRWRDGALVRTLTHPEGVTSVAFSPDGRWLASASYDHAVRIWDVRDGVLARTLTGHGGTVWSVAFSPDAPVSARQILAVRSKLALASHCPSGLNSTDQMFRVCPASVCRRAPSAVHSVAFSPDGRWLAASGADKTVRLWRLEVGIVKQGLLWPGTGGNASRAATGRPG